MVDLLVVGVLTLAIGSVEVPSEDAARVVEVFGGVAGGAVWFGGGLNDVALVVAMLPVVVVVVVPVVAVTGCAVEP